MKSTTVCYIEKDESFLMIHRTKKEKDENKDKWIGIGGKIEDGESPFDCIRREVREETGLTLNSLRYRGIVTFVSNEFPSQHMHLFTSDSFSGELAANCPEGDLAWIKKTELFALPMWEGDKIFHDLIEKNAPFFSLKLVYEGSCLKGSTLDFA